MRCARTCARGEPILANFNQRHTRCAPCADSRTAMTACHFRPDSRSRGSYENDRGWLCKTSIPGSNPGGASNLFFTLSNTSS
jgi:hypothetical protein